MKKFKSLNKVFIKIFALLILAVASLFISFAVNANAKADIYFGYDMDDVYTSVNPYSFTMEKFDVTYDVNADRTMTVCEDVTIHFTGAESTGFIRDIPINAGDKVYNVNVYELINGSEQSVDYDVYIESLSFLSVDIGDYTNKTQQTHTYRIIYDYHITKPTEKNRIELNAVGYGIEATVYDVTVTVNLPNGFIYDKTQCFVGSATSKDFSVNGNSVTAHVDKLDKFNGITFDFYFNDGALYVSHNYMPYLFSALGLILLAVIVIIRVMVFTKKPLVPIVNFSAPEDMDPLIMGKYIDNTIESSDVTSLIYYWASKGYLKINLDNEDDPVLIRVMRNLPDDTPQHQKVMYNNLFAQGDMVAISGLKEKFYTTTQKVKSMANASVKNLYKPSSITACVAFTLLVAVLTAVIPNICSMLYISSKFLVAAAFLINLIVSIFVCIITMAVYYYKLKLDNKKYRLALLGIWVAGVVATFVASLVLITAAVMPWGALLINAAVMVGSVMLTVSFITRTDSYTEKLNQILGFKNFISLVEKDRLEKMLADDPQLYYHVLPYAQVLGVSNIWENKFDGLTIAPPAYITGNRSLFETYLEIKIINRVLNRSMAKMTTALISSPKSSGASGGGFGGSFGGHGGGGHGGGGFRGR